MTIEEFLKQEYEDKGYEKSCFYNIRTDDSKERFTEEELIAFTKAYVAQLINKLSYTKSLINELRSRGCAISVWQIEDVESQCKSMNITLTKSQMLEVLKRADSKHDANEGLNWLVLSYYIDDIVRENKYNE